MAILRSSLHRRIAPISIGHVLSRAHKIIDCGGFVPPDRVPSCVRVAGARLPAGESWNGARPMCWLDTTGLLVSRRPFPKGHLPCATSSDGPSTPRPQIAAQACTPLIVPAHRIGWTLRKADAPPYDGFQSPAAGPASGQVSPESTTPSRPSAHGRSRCAPRARQRPRLQAGGAARVSGACRVRRTRGWTGRAARVHRAP